MECKYPNFELCGIPYEIELTDQLVHWLMKIAETKPFTTELQLCQRYYLKTPANSASYLPCTNASNHSRLHLMFPVTMRATPSASMSNYTVTATTHGVNGYQSSGSTDTQYEGTFDCSF